MTDIKKGYCFFDHKLSMKNINPTADAQMKKLKEFILGEKTISFAILHRKEIHSKKNGDPFLAMELGDASGHMSAVMWENVKSVHVEVGDVIKFSGIVEQYRHQKQIKVDKIRCVREDDLFDIEFLLPSTKTNRDALWQNYQRLIESIAQPFLLSLLHRIFEDEKFVKSFYDASASKRWHHAYLGGLLEHSLSVATICDRLSSLYPQVDRDLLVTAALLHDIGKIKTYTPAPIFDYTDVGRLIGHIVMGWQLISEKINEFPKFPESLSVKLQHLILSHQGLYENASPVIPMIPEGFILYYADEIDSKMNAIDQITNEDNMKDADWSNFINPIGRFLFLENRKK